MRRALATLLVALTLISTPPADAKDTGWGGAGRKDPGHVHHP